MQSKFSNYRLPINDVLNRIRQLIEVASIDPNINVEIVDRQNDEKYSLNPSVTLKISNSKLNGEVSAWAVGAVDVHGFDVENLDFLFDYHVEIVAPGDIDEHVLKVLNLFKPKTIGTN